MIPTKKDNDVYEDEGGLPWYLWALMLVGVVAIVSTPFCSAGDKKGKEMAERLKENRVYISKGLYDKVVKENP